MRGKEIRFFATQADIHPVLQEMDSCCPMQIFLAGMFDSPVPVGYQSLLEIPDYGFTDKGDWHLGNRYILIPKDALINVREVPQIKGGTRYAVDPMRNEANVMLILGGIYSMKPRILICGNMSTLSTSDFAIELYKQFSKSVKRQFHRIDDSYVGTEARELLHQGWWLSYNADAPKGMELRPDQDVKWPGNLSK